MMQIDQAVRKQNISRNQGKLKLLQQRLSIESTHIQKSQFRLPTISTKRRFQMQRQSSENDSYNCEKDNVGISRQKSQYYKKNYSNFYDRSRYQISPPRNSSAVSRCQISNSHQFDTQLSGFTKFKQKSASFFDPIKYGIGQRDPPQKPTNCDSQKKYSSTSQSTGMDSKLNFSQLANSLPVKQKFSVISQLEQNQDSNRQKLVPLRCRYRIYVRDHNNDYIFPKLEVNRQMQIMKQYPIRTKQEMLKQKMEQKIASYSMHKKRHFSNRKGNSLSEKMKKELYDAKIKRQQYFMSLNERQGRKKLKKLINDSNQSVQP